MDKLILLCCILEGRTQYIPRFREAVPPVLAAKDADPSLLQTTPIVESAKLLP